MLYNPPTGSTAATSPYVGKNVAAGTLGSKVPPGAAEFPQREIVNAALAASLSPTNSDMTQLAQAMSIGLWLGQMGGTANAIADTLPVLATSGDGVTVYAIPALQPGMTFHGIVPATNTGPATLTLTGFGTAPGPKAIVRKDGSPLQAGDQIAGATASWKWDGAAFRIVGMVASDVLALIAANGAVVRVTDTAGTSTAQALVGTASPGITTYGQSQVFIVTASATNTGPDPTLAVTGANGALAALAIRKRDGSALAPGDIPVGVEFLLALDAGGTKLRMLGLAISDLLITTAVTKVVGGNAGADFADLAAAFAWLSQYRITATGFVTFQCQAGKFTYASKNVVIAHPDLQRVKVFGATMKAAMPALSSYNFNGASASTRATDNANNLALLRNSFATELNFTGGGGISVQGPLAGFDALLLTGDGTGQGTGNAPLSGIGLALSNNAVVANSGGVAVVGFSSGVYLRCGAAIVGDPGAGSAAPLVSIGNTGNGFGFTAGGTLTVLGYSSAYLAAFGNGGHGFSFDTFSGLQAGNCSQSWSNCNGGYGVWSLQSTVNFAPGSRFSINGVAGVLAQNGGSFYATQGQINNNGNSGVLSYAGPTSITVTGMTIASNSGDGVHAIGNSYVRADSVTFSGNSGVPSYVNDGAQCYLNNSSGTSGSSPAVGTVGNNNALNTTA